MIAKQAELIDVPADKEAHIDSLIRDVTLMYGEAITWAMFDIFGRNANDPWPFADCCARLERLVDPTLGPLPPHVPAPVRANNALQAKLARQDFEIAALKRKDKAATLWKVLYARAHASHLKNFVINAVWNDERQFCGFLGIAGGPSPSIRAVHVCAASGIPAYLFVGIERATVGSWQRACVKGLKGLESLLAAVPVIAGPHPGLLTDPPPSPDDVFDRDWDSASAAYDRDGDYEAYSAATKAIEARYRAAISHKRSPL